jgi:chemotaxis protein methyltransferase WspC
LANEGRYEEAEKFCNAFLEVHPDSAHAHYLLGLIKNSQGQQKVAESLLKKAIYLDPNHEPALVLSCLLAEQKGDVESVQSFKRRIQRVQSRKR